jgi:hypothetical protein
LNRPFRRFAGLLCLLGLGGCLFTADQIEPTTKTVTVADSPSALFALLERAYDARSLATLDRILADDYQFVADARELTGSSESTWGRSVEMDRHSRMFEAIQNVDFTINRDSLSPIPEAAARETTWTVFNLEMTMDYGGQPYDVRGQADFRLRAVPQTDGSLRYFIVKWTDRNQ